MEGTVSVALAALRCHATDAAGLDGAERFARALGRRSGSRAA